VKRDSSREACSWSESLCYVSRQELPLSLCLTLHVSLLRPGISGFASGNEKTKQVDGIYDYTPQASAKVLGFMRELL